MYFVTEQFITIFSNYWIDEVAIFVRPLKFHSVFHTVISVINILSIEIYIPSHERRKAS